jgi:hypothetical protein
MNDRMPALNATSPGNQPVLPSIPDSWISKIFAKFEARYGSLFIDRWKDCDMTNVRETWAEELSGFRDQPDRIAYALRALADEKFPPTLPEFIAACRRAPRAGSLALEHKPTAEEREHQSEMAKRLGDSFGAGKLKDGIDTHWATHPRSVVQLRMIFDAAKNDQRFRPCIEQMVADGICSDEGRLLKVYRDRAFVKA